MPKISILIPVYNCEKTIKKCLKSALEQTFKDIEIIVINDGSKDRSLAIIKAIQKQDKRIKIINKRNTGYGNSLNIALSRAKGDFIGILEADDWLEKNALSIMSKYFEEYEIIKSSFNFIKSGKIFKTYDLNKNFNGEKESLVLIKPSIWSALYKKSFLDKNEIRFLNTQGASFQDTSFHFKTMCLVNKIKLVNSPLYNYRIDENEASSINSLSKINEIFLEFDEINNFLNQNFQLMDFLPNKILFEFRAYFWKFLRLKKEEKLDFVKRMAFIFKNYELENFYLDDRILLLDKLKLKFLIKSPYLFYLIFKNQKKRNER